jgi:hypothetical protein
MANGNAAAPKVAQGVGVAAPAPILPFPPVSPYPWSGAPDPTLGALLTTACQAQANVSRLGNHPHVPLSMIALATDGKHRYAGFLDTDMDFSASLLKVAVMYVAFELRAAANRLAVAKAITSQPDLVDALTKTFDAGINKAALDRVRNLPLGSGPQYGKILQYTGLAAPQGPVDFTVTAGAVTGFRNAMHDMVVVSDDPSASFCITALGYACLNSILMKAGFFKPGRMRGDERGIWVGGDYENAKQVRIRAVNEIDDQTGAYVTTTEAMCRLMAMIETGALVDDTALHGTSNQEMKDLLAETATAGNGPFIHDVQNAQPFTLRRNKLGIESLGRRTQGAVVASECSVLTWNTDPASDPDHAIANALAAHNLTGTLVICWQNVHDVEIQRHYDPISDIVVQTYQGLFNSP